PDGRVWIAVGKRDESGLSHWVHRMADWGRRLGVRPDEMSEAQSREDGRRMAELVSDSLGDRRVLLLFDDVWLEEEVTIFGAVGANSVRLLTTRIPKVA